MEAEAAKQGAVEVIRQRIEHARVACLRSVKGWVFNEVEDAGDGHFAESGPGGFFDESFYLEAMTIFLHFQTVSDSRRLLALLRMPSAFGACWQSLALGCESYSMRDGMQRERCI